MHRKTESTWIASAITIGPAALFAVAALGCDTTLPSARISGHVRLPIPNGDMPLPGPERLTRVPSGEVVKLTPVTLIQIAFSRQPDIKSSYQRFKEEEARYDFFVVSRDSLTPRIDTRSNLSEGRDSQLRAPFDVLRTREQRVRFSVEKRFFDTTELDVGVGLRGGEADQGYGSQPFVEARLRYPLWVSRQKLERTSEEIFRRNELNDAKLDYIQTVRRRLERTLFSFYGVIRQRRQLEHVRKWRADLETLLESLEDIDGLDLETNRMRIQAELGRVAAQEREMAGRFEIDVERLKGNCGLPFHVKIDIVDEPFNPFEGATHEELLRLSIADDPEIATLHNEELNAQVQLDLARRGRWDVTLQLDGASNLEGGGEDEGVSDWAVGFGLDVAMVDPRVTGSLSRQAQANISRFAQAVIARENEIFVDTLEPIIRIDTLGRSRQELIGNLPRFEQDYLTGLQEYADGVLNIDDLLKRRETLTFQQFDISRLKSMIGSNVAELCAATGKFFELLGGSDGD